MMQISGPLCIRVHFQADPFVRRAGSSADGDEFEGFIPDVLKNLTQMIGVASYEISLVKDGKYGELMRNGSWDGMIGELTREVSKLCSFISERELTFTFAICHRPSVCRLSVCRL